ncbi:MAG: D-alanyl-D-alanine carboxypeptidase [Spirochaetaceae bacterium]|jgi:D-alanyl-D-alanine carboxypeptidase (penicillin-binding protein 5/6)|nr:D-alanyl-D-alanine carboxypeptidase [Spirochaetaceae bacterium]GMO20611.1 MAG: D-alanyl-D-alanine carboxypeptidase family protein [Termitinemataceae bacterium]
MMMFIKFIRYITKNTFFLVFCAALYAEPSTPPELYSRAAVLMDAATGVILYAKNADERIPPASLTKLMTIHIAMQDAAERHLDFDAPVALPPAAWARNQPPRSTLMMLDEGQTVSLRELLLGLAVSSGNDAAVAVALLVSPGIEEFAAKMNNAAQELGLTQTFFVEPSGISEENWVTAREFAVFCRFYVNLYPKNLVELHSVPEFSYPKQENLPASKQNNPRTVTQTNRNGLLWRYPGVDGLKTGYIDESGYNLALSCERNGTRFICVLLGVPAELGAYWGARYRNNDGTALLDWGYSNFKTLRFERPELKKTRVWKGKESYINVEPYLPGQSASDMAALSVPVGRGGELSMEVEYLPSVTAPFLRGERLGTLFVFDSEGKLAEVPLVATKEVKRANILKRIWDSIMMLFLGL